MLVGVGAAVAKTTNRVQKITESREDIAPRSWHGDQKGEHGKLYVSCHLRALLTVQGGD